jgi:hypothetical protein
MALSSKETVDIINKMALNDRANNHNRSSAQRKSRILELGSTNANLAQNKIMTQQLEEMKTQMNDMPKLIKEQLQREQWHQQNFVRCVPDIIQRAIVHHHLKKRLILWATNKGHGNIKVNIKGTPIKGGI